MPGTVFGFICLPFSPFICLPLSAWMPGAASLSPGCRWTGSFVSPKPICLPLSPSLAAWHGSLRARVHLSPFVSPCLARISGWTGSLPSFVSRCRLHAGTALWVDRFICLALSPFICLSLLPSLDAWHGSLGDAWHGSCLPSFVSRCLPAWMVCGWTGSFVSLCLICLPLSPSLIAWHSGWAGPFVSL